MLITSAEEFGKIIKNRRKELGYTQGYVSEFTGLSVSFLSELENGKKTAEIGKAIEVANILGLDIEMKSR